MEKQQGMGVGVQEQEQGQGALEVEEEKASAAVETGSLEDKVTLAELKAKIGAFVDARNWSKSHDGKNLAMSIAIEAAELMEHFQWGERSEYTRENISDEEMHEIRLEVADVMIYLLSFCRSLGIDIARAVHDKVEINEKRFPVEKYRNE